MYSSSAGKRFGGHVGDEPAYHSAIQNNPLDKQDYLPTFSAPKSPELYAETRHLQG